MATTTTYPNAGVTAPTVEAQRPRRSGAHRVANRKRATA